MKVYGISYTPKMFGNLDIMTLNDGLYEIHKKLFSSKDKCREFLKTFFVETITKDRQFDSDFDFDKHLVFNRLTDDVISVGLSSDYIFDDDDDYLNDDPESRYYSFEIVELELD